MNRSSRIQNKQSKHKYWISPYERIIGLIDEKNKLAQIYEYSSRGVCSGAAAWVAYHYPRTSSIIRSAESEGARSIFTLELKKGKLNLQPSLSPAGIESVELINNEIAVTYSGLAGGGVGISKCRASADNISNVEILSEGGGSSVGRAVFKLPYMKKIHIGIDDTDSKEEGATWSLANEIGFHASRKDGMEYLNHTIVQLYPKAPGKTKNCVSTALTFGVEPEKKKALIQFITNKLQTNTLSGDTGLAVFEGIKIPNKLKTYSRAAKKRIIKLSDTEALAEEFGIELIEITGTDGLIGATAALGYAESHKKAVELI